MSDPENRRPLKSRATGWANTLASAAGRAKVSPDVISALSVCFAALGGALLLWSGATESSVTRAILLILAAACIQLRLLCNLLDGMVAVEHGLGGPNGPLWNELPDRIADAMLLVAAGYAVEAGWLGWLCAVLALLTAYVRELGRALGKPADFSGPMAKPHRMAALTLACLIAAAEPLWGWHGQTLAMALMIIAAATALTAGRRTARLARSLHEAP